MVKVVQGVLTKIEVESAMMVLNAGAFLNVDEKTTYTLAQKGEIPGLKVLGSWRPQRHDLDEWIQVRKDGAKLSFKINRI
jgi:excisionase family DNA binding protein